MACPLSVTLVNHSQYNSIIINLLIIQFSQFAKRFSAHVVGKLQLTLLSKSLLVKLTVAPLGKDVYVF